MDPIRVPRPPQQAFNKNRPVSDLLKAQIKHFQHLEDKLHPDMRSSMPAHELTTESAAARYIAHMTETLRSESLARSLPQPRRIRTVTTGASRPKSGLAIAAAEDNGRATKPSRTKKSVSKPKGSAKDKKQGKRS